MTGDMNRSGGIPELRDTYAPAPGSVAVSSGCGRRSFAGVGICTWTWLSGAAEVCDIALTMMRLIQRKVRLASGDGGKDGADWSYGIPGARIARALRDWQVLEHPGGTFQMLNSSGEDIRRILAALGVELTPKIYSKGDLAAIKAAVKAF